MPAPTPADFYAALVTVIETGEEKKVGTTRLDPKREWPLSSEALWALANDFARAENQITGACNGCSE